MFGVEGGDIELHFEKGIIDLNWSVHSGHYVIMINIINTPYKYKFYTSKNNNRSF